MDSSLTLPHRSNASNQYSSAPPCHLAGLVHSLFLSTLLQPSAILLALWYIVRLPVFFGPVGLGPEQVKELRFRAELLGSAPGGADSESLETDAPFRLILLGCMLANKWLDDHTFSNKTWYVLTNHSAISDTWADSFHLFVGNPFLMFPSNLSTGWNPLRSTSFLMISRLHPVLGRSGSRTSLPIISLCLLLHTLSPYPVHRRIHI